MSYFVITHPSLGWQPIANSEATQNHPLGTIVQAVDRAATAYGAGEFIYLKGAAATAAGFKLPGSWRRVSPLLAQPNKRLLATASVMASASSLPVQFQSVPLSFGMRP